MFPTFFKEQPVRLGRKRTNKNPPSGGFLSECLVGLRYASKTPPLRSASSYPSSSGSFAASFAYLEAF